MMLICMSLDFSASEHPYAEFGFDKKWESCLPREIGSYLYILGNHWMLFTMGGASKKLGKPSDGMWLIYLRRQERSRFDDESRVKCRRGA